MNVDCQLVQHRPSNVQTSLEASHVYVLKAFSTTRKGTLVMIVMNVWQGKWTSKVIARTKYRLPWIKYWHVPTFSEQVAQTCWTWWSAIIPCICKTTWLWQYSSHDYRCTLIIWLVLCERMCNLCVAFMPVRPRESFLYRLKFCMFVCSCSKVDLCFLFFKELELQLLSDLIIF